MDTRVWVQMSGILCLMTCVLTVFGLGVASIMLVGDLRILVQSATLVTDGAQKQTIPSLTTIGVQVSTVLRHVESGLVGLNLTTVQTRALGVLDQLSVLLGELDMRAISQDTIEVLRGINQTVSHFNHTLSTFSLERETVYFPPSSELF